MDFVASCKRYFWGVLALALWSCNPETEKPKGDQVAPPTPVKLQYPNYFGIPSIADTNPLTKEGINLGRFLFYETKLSRDNTISCASCHIQNNGFSDPRILSPGVDGTLGKRQSMALVNLAWEGRFFWDGRSPTLEDQVLHPIQDQLEMKETLPSVIGKLQNTALYPPLFTKAFGNEVITTGKISKALSQFIRTIVSTDTKYDQYLKGTYTPTDEEALGLNLFFMHPDPRANPPVRGGNCGDCHLQGQTAGNRLGFAGFKNNGLHRSEEESNFDAGLFHITNNPRDKGKMKVPSLRNIALTAPYMHDGSIATLEDVVDHYNHPDLFTRFNVDSLIKTGFNDRRNPTALGLTPTEKQALVTFMRNMLTDQSLISNEALKNPHTNP